MVVTWIQEDMRRESMHPLIHDIIALLYGCTTITVQHVYQKINLAVDWIAFYVAEHSGDFLWTNIGEAPGQLQDIIFFDFFLLYSH